MLPLDSVKLVDFNHMYGVKGDTDACLRVSLKGDTGCFHRFGGTLKVSIVAGASVIYLFLDLSPPPFPIIHCRPRGAVNAHITGRTQDMKRSVDNLVSLSYNLFLLYHLVQ